MAGLGAGHRAILRRGPDRGRMVLSPLVGVVLVNPARCSGKMLDITPKLGQNPNHISDNSPSEQIAHSPNTSRFYSTRRLESCCSPVSKLQCHAAYSSSLLFSQSLTRVPRHGV